MRDDLMAAFIIVHHGYAGNGQYGWGAVLNWIDGKWAQDGTVEGEIRTRYREKTLAAAVDAVLDVALTFKLPLICQFAIFADDTAKDQPDDADELVAAENKRRGWGTAAAAKVNAEAFAISKGATE